MCLQKFIDDMTRNDKLSHGNGNLLFYSFIQRLGNASGDILIFLEAFPLLLCHLSVTTVDKSVFFEWIMRMLRKPLI